MTYEVNAATTISETLEGETIIINMKSGAYFSLNETGSLVWNGIVAKRSAEQIAASLGERYEADQAVISAAVDAMLATLEENELVIPSASVGAPKEAYVGEKRPFIVPAVQKYDDMQEMLLADPIHDVDETGWPSLKK